MKSYYRSSYFARRLEEIQEKEIELKQLIEPEL